MERDEMLDLTGKIIYFVTNNINNVEEIYTNADIPYFIVPIKIIDISSSGICFVYHASTYNRKDKVRIFSKSFNKIWFLDTDKATDKMNEINKNIFDYLEQSNILRKKFKSLVKDEREK